MIALVENAFLFFTQWAPLTSLVTVAFHAIRKDIKQCSDHEKSNNTHAVYKKGVLAVLKSIGFSIGSGFFYSR